MKISLALYVKTHLVLAYLHITSVSLRLELRFHHIHQGIPTLVILLTLKMKSMILELDNQS